MQECDVAIAGAGPAGLQCALVLGRARRRVVVFDSGKPRNAPADQTHGMLSRDGLKPSEMLRLAREQLAPYDVEVRHASVDDAALADDGFALRTSDGELRARRLVIATGMRDELPHIEGLNDQTWGSSVFVCPYCDGWEVRDRPIAAFGNTRSGVGLARELYQWSRDIVVCSDMKTTIAPDERAWLERTKVRVIESPIARLIADGGRLRRIEFESGEGIDREALFLSVQLVQASGLAARIGCNITTRGHIDVDAEYRTNVPGCYAIGDAVTTLHQVIFAAASGARAAIALNNELTDDAAEPKPPGD
jgi:thioredoxin reductase